MRLITIFLSVVTLGYLTYSFITLQQASNGVVKKMTTPTLIAPAYIDDAPLAAEQAWEQLKTKRIKAKQPIKKKNTNILKNKKLLTIGKSQYVLYGIFNAGVANKNKINGSEIYSLHNKAHLIKAFVLIKPLVNKGDSAAQMLKIKQGEELTEGVFLVAVTTNSISFKQNNQLIEFKLFEAKK